MEAPHGFSFIHVHAPSRTLAKLRKGMAARIKGGDIPLLVHAENFNHITRTFSKGKGLNLKMSAEELAHNHGLGLIGGKGGIFGKKADKAFKKAGIKKAVYKVGAALKPLAQEAIHVGTQMGAQALSAYAPEFAPFINQGATALDKTAQAYIEDPDKSRKNIKGKYNAIRKDPSAALAAASEYAAKSGLGDLALGQLSQATGEDLGSYADLQQKYNTVKKDPRQYAIQQASDYSGHDIQGYMDAYKEAKNAPPSRGPLTEMFNAYTGQDIGKLDKAAAGSYLQNMGLAELEQLVQKKRLELQEKNARMLDYSGGDSRSMYADDVPDDVVGHGLYGHGLYGHGLYGEGLYGHGMRNHIRRPVSNRREMSSVGCGGTLIGAEPPAFRSQPLSANFQFGSRLGPAFLRVSHSGAGLY